MPLSWPYGVTGPVVGQMFHVKHSLWHRWCSGRRRPRLWGRAAVCARGRRPAREPSAPRAFGSARRLEARPGPATAHRHRGQALRSLRRPLHQWRLGVDVRLDVSTRCPARPRHRPPEPRTCPRWYAKSPQPLRVCGLAWNSGGAGIRSVAVGLHDVLGVGELVELIDVGLGNHDVDGREHE